MSKKIWAENSPAKNFWAKNFRAKNFSTKDYLLKFKNILSEEFSGEELSGGKLPFFLLENSSGRRILRVKNSPAKNFSDFFPFSAKLLGLKCTIRIKRF
jgi:hypothetical protein